jgi:serine/threonine protein kinase
MDQSTLVDGMNEEMAWVMLKQLLQGLAFLHHGVGPTGDAIASIQPFSGILHLDMKPANILVYYNGDQHKTLMDKWTFKTTDFGHSEFENDPPIKVGTSFYASPDSWEINSQYPGIHQKTGTAASDVFMLGASIHVALTGQPPKWFFDERMPIGLVLGEGMYFLLVFLKLPSRYERLQVFGSFVNRFNSQNKISSTYCIQWAI